MKTFAQLLLAFREARGIDVQVLASKAGLSKGYVSMLQNGKKKPPRLQTVVAIADVMQLDLEERELLFKAAGFELNVIDRLTGSTDFNDGDIGLRYGWEGPSAAGIEKIFPNLLVAVIHAKLATATKRIRIFDSWLDSPASYVESFRVAAKANPNVKIEVLLLDPESPIAAQRSIDLGMESEEPSEARRKTDNFVSDSVRRSVQLFRQLRKNNDVDLELRFFKSLPSIQFIQCDDYIFIGFFAHGRQSNISPQLLIREGDELNKTTLGAFFADEFDSVWNNTNNTFVPLKDADHPRGSPKHLANGTANHTS